MMGVSSQGYLDTALAQVPQRSNYCRHGGGGSIARLVL